MDIEQATWTESDGWSSGWPGSLKERAQVVLLFGGREAIDRQEQWTRIRETYPKAHLLGCSTAGEIMDTQVRDRSLSLTAIGFTKCYVQVASVNVREVSNSWQAGECLARRLEPRDLRHVFVLSDGLKINGSELVKGLTEYLPKGVAVTGGLSGDSSDFKKTLVFLNEPPQEGTIAVMGIYGEHLKVGYGSLGGWDTFGPDRKITRSKENVLYELDGQSALSLYKKYLGDKADGLPASGLLFPLSVRVNAADPGVVRTLLGINESEQSMTFAGDIPQGSSARLMRANFDRLIDGAIGAAATSLTPMGLSSVELAILISCVGRKIVLKQRIEEEVEGVRGMLGPQCRLTGFYSYGEISPFTPNARCELHNQTMTITTLSEK